MSVNKVILLGNACADPKVTRFDNGGAVAQLSLATNKKAYKTKEGKEIPEQTEFHNVVINRTGLVGVAEKYIHKGDRLYIEGELRTRQYADNGGIKHFITEIYVDTLEMLTPKGNAATPPTPEEPEDEQPY